MDRAAGLLNVRRTVSSGEVVELAKTARSRRQVPLSPRAIEAIDALPPRLDTPYLIPARRGGVFDLANFRRREWKPAIDASGVRKPARIYPRSTFASNALAAGVSVFELARIMGTSVAMIERSYGTLIEGAGADIARRLAAFEAADEQAEDVWVTTGPRDGGRRIGGSTREPAPAQGERREPETGFEPVTPALRERCSGQLSYSGARPILGRPASASGTSSSTPRSSPTRQTRSFSSSTSTQVPAEAGKTT